MGCVLTALAAPLAGLLRRLILYCQSLDRLPDRNDSDNASVVTAWSSSDSSLDAPTCSALVLAKERAKERAKQRAREMAKASHSHKSVRQHGFGWTWKKLIEASHALGPHALLVPLLIQLSQLNLQKSAEICRGPEYAETNYV